MTDGMLKKVGWTFFVLNLLCLPYDAFVLNNPDTFMSNAVSAMIVYFIMEDIKS